MMHSFLRVCFFLVFLLQQGVAFTIPNCLADQQSKGGKARVRSHQKDNEISGFTSHDRVQSVIQVRFHDSMTGTIDLTSTASLCHRNGTGIEIEWKNIDQEIIATYENCNDPLYKQDAVEVFIALPETYPREYLECEISPRGVIFLSWIINYNGDCSHFKGDLKSCDLLPERSAQKVANGWNAKVFVPFDIIKDYLSARVGADHKIQAGEVYMNLFRIDKSSTVPTKYLSMNPTYTKTPCFHVPSQFEKVSLGRVVSLQQ